MKIKVVLWPYTASLSFVLSFINKWAVYSKWAYWLSAARRNPAGNVNLFDYYIFSEWLHILMSHNFFFFKKKDSTEHYNRNLVFTQCKIISLTLHFVLFWMTSIIWSFETFLSWSWFLRKLLFKVTKNIWKAFLCL